MTAAALVTEPAFIWPEDDAVILFVTEGVRYNAALQELCRTLLGRFQDGVIVTANRPYQSLREGFATAGLDVSRLRFVDCVTSLTGLVPPPDPHALHIESPTLLEKLSMRTEQLLRRQSHSRFLLVDSLSTLAVYNGADAVAEFTHNLVTRLRMQRIPAALLLVRQPGGQGLLDTVEPLCDGPVHL